MRSGQAVLQEASMACWLTSLRRDAVTQTWRVGRRFQEPIRGIWSFQCLLKNCAQNWIETCHVSIIILNAGLAGPEWFNSCLHEICTGSTHILLYPIVLFLRSLWMLLPLPHYSSLALSRAAHSDFCKKMDCSGCCNLGSLPSMNIGFRAWRMVCG